MSKPRKKAREAAAEQAEPMDDARIEPAVDSTEDPDTPAADESAQDDPRDPAGNDLAAAAVEADALDAQDVDVSEDLDSEPEDPLETLRLERDAFQEKWLRAVAEMENVRKRARRELQDGRRFAQADLLRPLLEVHDNFERALQSFPEDEDTSNGSGIREGVDLIFQKFRSVLKDKGVEPIPALDLEFDPKIHDAVGQLAREGVEAGTVIEVVQTGFLLGGDFVLRPARVIVAG